MAMKPVEELTVQDLAKHPVWQMGDDLHDTCVSPVRRLPVKSLGRRLVGTRLTLHNGMVVWGLLGNLSLRSTRQNDQFLSVGVEKDGKRFWLARYFDVDYEERGPAQLAGFLGLSVDEVFPISYDVSAVAIGTPETVRGLIPAEPKERLSREERVRLFRQ